MPGHAFTIVKTGFVKRLSWLLERRPSGWRRRSIQAN
ncbi:hypothetical protein RE6C_04690 [Rhodopirellula europaea 6C]|uniref:Uncharacterized protein n=1 Tax=Rhodopirellula europaea 6C TaxID=1263867 RepID=M2AXK0_9BACT|nr:hypothetical protein RE6C_04690 [Rhodopirellula europaea 6C]